MTVTRPTLALVLALATLAGAGPARAQGDAGAYLAARSAVIWNDHAAAADWFARALARDPGNPELMEGGLVAALSIGDFDRATALAARMQAAGIRSQTAHITLLTDLAHRGEWSGVIAALDAGLGVGALVDGLVRAWAQVGAGRMSDALQGFDAIATAPGLEAFGLYHKAMALASVGDFEGAEAILANPGGAELRITRRGVVARVQILSQIDRADQALALIDSEFGTGPSPLTDPLRAALTAGNPIPFDAVRNAADGMAEVFFTTATALNAEADADYTLLYAQVAARLRADHTDAILLAADLLNRQEQPELAAATFARVPPQDPAFHEAEIGRAEALHAAGQTEAAVQVLTALDASHGNIVVVPLALGDMLRRQERWPEATAAYDRAIALVGAPEPRHWVLFYNRGITLERSRQWDRADADFRQALALNPDQPQVLNYLGYSLIERGQNLDEALGMIERAVAARPDSGYIIDSLAWALFKLGRFDEALEPMERASLLEPVDPIVTDHLGDVYWAVGRLLEARFQWRRALSFEPEPTEAERIRRKLEVGLDAVLAAEGAPSLADTAARAAAADGN
ncbi:MAG: tetratricopeptide repeat protein [Rhodobacterales bacterium]|nr:tetratricopeptide repeat protein [Rhodobacterales bacterium]